MSTLHLATHLTSALPQEDTTMAHRATRWRTLWIWAAKPRCLGFQDQNDTDDVPQELIDWTQDKLMWLGQETGLTQWSFLCPITQTPRLLLCDVDSNPKHGFSKTASLWAMRSKIQSWDASERRNNMTGVFVNLTGHEKMSHIRNLERMTHPDLIGRDFTLCSHITA